MLGEELYMKKTKKPAHCNALYITLINVKIVQVKVDLQNLNVVTLKSGALLCVCTFYISNKQMV